MAFPERTADAGDLAKELVEEPSRPCTEHSITPITIRKEIHGVNLIAPALEEVRPALEGDEADDLVLSHDPEHVSYCATLSPTTQEGERR